MSETSNAERGGLGKAPQSMLPALALGLAAFLTNFDVTATVIALPVMARELGFGVAGYAWVMDAYSLAFTASLLIAGALADKHGRRLAMLRGNAAFAIASLACGIAWNGPTLWGARMLQGVSAAFIVTGGIALIFGAYPQPEARTRAFAWLGVISGIAMALGPTIGGLVVSWIGWRWIFLLNLPACALVAWGVPRLVAETREASPRPLDLLGVVLLTSAIGSLIHALLHGHSVPTHMAGGLFLSVLLLAVFTAQQMRRKHPILDPVVFARPVMIGIATLLFAVSIGYWAVLVYLPFFLSVTFGWSSQTAGLALLAPTLPMLLLPPVGGRLVGRLGWQLHFAIALAAMAAGNAAVVMALALNGGPTPIAVVAFGMIAIGIGAALAHPQLSGAVVALVPADEAGMAAAVTVVMRQAGFAIGIAILGAVLQAENGAVGYFWLFSVASVASLLGLAAALILLPSRTAESAQ